MTKCVYIAKTPQGIIVPDTKSNDADECVSNLVKVTRKPWHVLKKLRYTITRCDDE